MTSTPRTRPYRRTEIAISASSIIIGVGFVLVTVLDGPPLAREILLALAFLGLAIIGVINGLKTHGKDLPTQTMAYMAAGLALILMALTLWGRILP